MCQILGINTSEVTPFAMNFCKFCDRGGCSDVHKDGWGLCFYQNRGVVSFYDTCACCHSAMAEYVRKAEHQTSNLLAHIRLATRGDVNKVENLHPFVRELWGITWCFAHNGDLPHFAHISKHHHVLLGKSTVANLSHHAIGDTDSEAVFCAILNALQAEFHELPTLHELHDFLLSVCRQIESEGDILNFVLLCGPHTLFAYSLPGRRSPSTIWNGLYYMVRHNTMPSSPSQVKLDDDDYSVVIPNTSITTTTNDDSGKTDTASSPRRIAIIATKPLLMTGDYGSGDNSELWTEMKPRELLMFDRGIIYSKTMDLDTMERAGRGLSSRCVPKETAVVAAAME